MYKIKALADKGIEDANLLSVTIFGHALEFEEGDFHLGLGLFDRSDALVGFAVGQAVFEQAELYYIGVSPCARQQGLGSRLLLDFIKKCREKGAETLFLEVRGSNTQALSFYKKAGFKVYGSRKNYYKNGEDAILMQKEAL